MDKREKARRSGARRTKMRRKASMVCITLLSLAVAGVMSVQMVSLYEKNQDYRDRKKQLEADLEDEQLRQDELKEREEYITTKEYIENIAKTKLGLVYPNEIIFKETEEAP